MQEIILELTAERTNHKYNIEINVINELLQEITYDQHFLNTYIYFIPSSEFNAYLKQIKVLLSAVKNVSYFFTSDKYDLCFFTVTTEAVSTT